MESLRLGVAHVYSRCASAFPSPTFPLTHPFPFKGSAESEAATAGAAANLDKLIRDPKLRELLTPTYPGWFPLDPRTNPPSSYAIYMLVGCRRLTPHEHYLDALQLPTTTIVKAPIEKFTDKGIVAGGVEYECDVIIKATGFGTLFKTHFGRIRGLADAGLDLSLRDRDLGGGSVNLSCSFHRWLSSSDLSYLHPIVSAFFARTFRSCRDHPLSATSIPRRQLHPQDHRQGPRAHAPGRMGEVSVHLQVDHELRVPELLWVEVACEDDGDG